MLLASGCQTENITRNSAPEGIISSYAAQSPPDILKEGATIGVAIELKNNADLNVNGKTCVKGVLKGYGGFEEEQCQDFGLNGARIVNNKIVKSSDVLRFSSEGYKTNGREVVEAPLLAKTTYGCEFMAGPTFCVSNRIYADSAASDASTKCEQTESFTGKSLNSKSAPITLTKVTKLYTNPSDGTTDLEVMLTFKKAGDGGYVVNSLDDDEIQKSHVKISVSYGSKGDLKCDEVREGKIEWKRDENEKVINCGISLGGVSELDYSMLNVRLNYYYRIVKPKTITIKQAKNEDIINGGGGW